MSRRDAVGGSHSERIGGVRYSLAFKVLGPTPRSVAGPAGTAQKNPAAARRRAGQQGEASAQLAGLLNGWR